MRRTEPDSAVASEPIVTDDAPQPPADVAAAAAPDPTPVPAAAPVGPSPEVLALREQIAEMRGRMTAMEAVSLRAATPPTEIDDISDEALEAALAEGKGASAVRKAMDARIERLRRTDLAQMNDQVNGYGMPAIQALALKIARGDMKYYDRYKPEIDQTIAGMAPQIKLQPENLKYAHDIIVGGHMEELLAEEREKTIRSMRENPGGTGGPAGRAAAPVRTTPTAGDLFGAESARMVAQAGGEDAFAKKLGHKDWDTYLAKNKDYIGETEGNA